jgi:addiction module HigA family antidote
MTLHVKPPLPGSLIRQILKRTKVKQAELARAMGISTVRISQLINGARITPEMALRLGRVTSTAPDYWLRLQNDYDLFIEARRLAETLQQLPVLQQPRRLTADPLLGKSSFPPDLPR